MYVESLQRLLAQQLPEAAIRRIEGGASAQEACAILEEAGYLDLLLAEEAQGPGLELEQVSELFRLLGRMGIPLPLAATWLARRMLPRDACPSGLIAAVSGHIDAQGRINCPRVPGGALAGHVLVAVEGELLLVTTASAVIHETVGDPRALAARLAWRQDDVVWRQDHGAAVLQAWLPAATAAQMAGGLEMVLELSLTHCNQRHQFGKSIAQFQAVQHQLSVMAEHVLAASLSAELAFGSASSDPAWLQAAIAKARASEASVLVCATAHAVHGAIGMTDEYALGLYTRRLREWRMDHGSESHWHAAIGSHVLADSRSVAEVVIGL